MSLVRRGRRAPRTSMMRPLTLLMLLPILLVTCLNNTEEPPDNVCDEPKCVCNDRARPPWIIVNCDMSKLQTLDLYEGSVPSATSELILKGAEFVTFKKNLFSRMLDLRLVQIHDVKNVVMERYLAVELYAVSAYIEIEHCDTLRIEESAFKDIKGPLSVTINNCTSVTLEGQAFSWLLEMRITNVNSLKLSPGVFMLDPSADNVGTHGPGMSIVMKNVAASEIPAQAFGSSAAEIKLMNCDISKIRSGAFSANTYSVITIANSSIYRIESEAFSQKSLINNLNLQGVRLHDIVSKGLQSAITKLSILSSRFDKIETGAINSIVASVNIADSEFHKFFIRGIEFISWNKLRMARNKFDTLPPYAVVAIPTIVNELYFADNEVESLTTNSLAFIGQAFAGKYGMNIHYKNNYFGVMCHCNISLWLAEAFGTTDGNPYEAESYCMVNRFFATCFNVPELNIDFKKFLKKACSEDSVVACEMYKLKSDVPTLIENPRFPHKKPEETKSERDKKIIGIVVVTALGCIIIVMFISLIRCMKRRGHCATLRYILTRPNSCGSFCSRLCVCGRQNNRIDNERLTTHFSVSEFSERLRLNEPSRSENMIVESVFPGEAIANVAETSPVDDKTTQTLPEELTKELLENLKEKLEDPENYVEAREMIEHLYELIKVEESCNTNVPTVIPTEENIYELPFQNTTPRIGKNKKELISVGTRAPSLDKLLPLSPYNRQTALAHEYFEPKDFAIHLYAEIANCDKEKRTLLGTIPDVVEQVVPRGPYLRAVREKTSSPNSSSAFKPFNDPTTSPIKSPIGSHLSSPIQSPSSIKSSKSSASDSSGKMINRPLPEKPAIDPGEGTSMVAV